MSISTRPPGVYDRPPAEAAYAAAISAALSGALAAFGYQAIDTPLIEYADLFLTKSGDEAINRLFSFELYGRQLCLRPEFTASAARLYVEQFQAAPKPIRWQSSGAVFRYETPGRGHSRQFTMLGAELIGAAGAAGDAETLGMAARGLYAVGVRDWTLRVGHVGLAASALDRFDLDRRTRRFLLGQIENLRRPDRGRAFVQAQFEALIAAPNPARSVPESLLANAEPTAEMTHALQLLIESADLGTVGTGRTHEDVARRLLTKQRRSEQRGEVAAALDFLEAFAAIQGVPDAAFAALDALLLDDSAIRATVREFRAALDLLPAYGVPSEQIQVQMGLARGLNYYTGIVFEIHANGDSTSNTQLCGGGRYDDLIRVLGAAHEMPAVGFAYGLERIGSEAERAGFTPKTEPRTQTLVIAATEADQFAAAQLATRLRDSVRTELYPAANLSAALNYAERAGIPFALVIGEAEWAAGTVAVHRIGHANPPSQVPLDHVEKVVSL